MLPPRPTRTPALGSPPKSSPLGPVHAKLPRPKRGAEGSVMDGTEVMFWVRRGKDEAEGPNQFVFEKDLGRLGEPSEAQ